MIKIFTTTHENGSFFTQLVLEEAEKSKDITPIIHFKITNFPQ